MMEGRCKAMVLTLQRVLREIPGQIHVRISADHLKKFLEPVPAAARFLGEQVKVFLQLAGEGSCHVEVRALAALRSLWHELEEIDVAMREGADKCLEKVRQTTFDRSRPDSVYDDALQQLEIAQTLDDQREAILTLCFAESAPLHSNSKDGSKAAAGRARLQALYDRAAMRKGLKEQCIAQKNWRWREARYNALKQGKAAIAKLHSKIQRTGTRLIAERFLPDEEIFECECCGAGMSERKRVKGKHILVCGHCDNERELAAPRAAVVARHDFFKAREAQRDLLKPLEGITTWKCGECGAEVDCQFERMTDRCGYCGSSDFVRVERDGGVLQPQGMLRFACDAARAEQLLRQWVRQRGDAALGFARRFKVVTAQARYVPYWIFDFVLENAGGADFTCSNIHACASKQLLMRMPSELRGIEPFETRKVPPFEPGHLAGVVSERFSVDLEQAWKNVQDAARRSVSNYLGLNQSSENVDNALARTRVTFKYLLMPVYFFIVSYKGREYHALVDGAGAGVGIDYPKSILKRGTRLAIAGVALVLLLAIGAIGIPRLMDVVNERAELEAKSRAEKEAEFAAGEKRYAAYQEQLKENRRIMDEWKARSDKGRSWTSRQFSLRCEVLQDRGIVPRGFADVELQLSARFNIEYWEMASVLEALNQADVQVLMSHLASAGLAGEVLVAIDGTIEHYYERALAQLVNEVLILAGKNNRLLDPEKCELRLIAVSEPAKPTLTGFVDVHCRIWKGSDYPSKAVFTLHMQPDADVAAFCEEAASEEIGRRLLLRVLDNDDWISNPFDERLAFSIVKEGLAKLMERQRLSRWLGEVQLDSVKLVK